MPSPYTMQKLKAYKSLEGCKQFVDGWVFNAKVSAITSHSSQKDKFLITAKVKHLQRLSVPHVKTWVAAEKGGAVVCAHCNCMAGLGEACSYIAAILFTLNANVQARKSLSYASVLCSWLPPTFKNVTFAPISDINFADPWKRLKAMVGTSSSSKCSVSSACEGEGTSSSSKTLTNLKASSQYDTHSALRLRQRLRFAK